MKGIEEPEHVLAAVNTRRSLGREVAPVLIEASQDVIQRLEVLGRRDRELDRTTMAGLTSCAKLRIDEVLDHILPQLLLVLVQRGAHGELPSLGESW